MANKTKNSNLSLEERLEQALIPNWDEPYKLPPNWCWVKLDSISEILNGYAFKSSLYTENGIRIVRITNVQDGFIEDEKPVFYPFNAKSEIEQYMLKNNDLLMSLTGNVGRVALMKEEFLPAALNQRVACLRMKSSTISTKYLFYCLLQKHFIDDCSKSAKGSAQLNMSTEWLKGYSIPLPPTHEQLRIVERIESLFAKLDEAKEKAQEVVDGFETRKAAILRKAFSGELTAKWRKSQDILQTWSYVELQQITVKIGDGLHGTPTYTQNTDYYFINGNNLSGHSIEIKPDTKTVDRTEYEKNYIELDDQTVLLSINGTLGNTAFYAGEKVILGKSACYITVQKDVLDKYYLRYYLTSKEFCNFAHANATGSTIKNLGLKQIRQHKIPLPSIEEQREIVSILNSIITKETDAKETAEAVIEQIDTMKKAILARAFRGELGTNDPSEESAVELLKKVLSGGEN